MFLPYRELERNRLTYTENEVCKLICLGYQNKEIAYKLNISVNTVKKNVSNILAKGELKNRTQIAIEYRKMTIRYYDNDL